MEQVEWDATRRVLWFRDAEFKGDFREDSW